MKVVVQSCVIVCLMAFGCSGEPEKEPTSIKVFARCSSDTACRADELCLQGLCRPACGDDSQCTAGTRCIDTGRGTVCAPPSADSCLNSNDCEDSDDDIKTGTNPNKDKTKQDTTPSGVAGASTGASGAPAAPNSPDSGNAIDAGLAATNTDAGVPVMAMLCPRGSALCEGTSVVVCNARGEREVERRCPFACAAGTCAGACATGAQRCLGKIRQVCDPVGAWQNTETCSNLCTPSGCRTGCSEGSRQCDGPIATVCRNGSYVEEQSCKFVCQAGACTGDCAPGTYQCTNNALAACSVDGHWLTPTRCLNACTMGACTGVCTPGKQRCGGSSGYQICSDSGQWGSTSSCGDKACVDGFCTGACEPGTTRCEDGQTITACGTNGSWGSPMPCASQACVAGRCTGVCAPGERRCDATSARSVQHCDASGSWTNGLSCEPNQVCSNSGECVAGPSCQSGSAPDWLVTASGRGDAAWMDPRWGSDTATQFGRSFAPDAAGYIALFDRVANDLVVTFRVWSAPGETPTSADYVYLSIASNQPTASFSAHDTKIPLIALSPGDSARPVNAYESGLLANGSWSLQSASDGWISDVAAWRGNDGSTLAWAVSVRVDLDRAGVDPAHEFRMAVKVHLDGRGDAFSPGTGTQLSDTPADWSRVTLSSGPCVVPVVL